ncbi:hypothetical protein HAX54_051662, partial [Datura stramonium]|nr:hypothetical protein [Datura stramonium]
KADTRPGARRPAPLRLGRCDTGNLQRVGRRATAHSPSNKACDAVLGQNFDKGDASRRFPTPKMDLPLQLGKETLNPKSNSSRNKEIINLLL